MESEDFDDIYSEESIESQFDDDLISAEEEGFMIGYVEAGVGEIEWVGEVKRKKAESFLRARNAKRFWANCGEMKR